MAEKIRRVQLKDIPEGRDCILILKKDGSKTSKNYVVCVTRSELVGEKEGQRNMIAEINGERVSFSENMVAIERTPLVDNLLARGIFHQKPKL